MEMNAGELESVEHLAERALNEDLEPAGVDLTSASVIPDGTRGSAALVARKEGVLAGLAAAQIVFKLVDPTLQFHFLVKDGSRISAGLQLATVSGEMRSILTGERTALNFVQHLSGVATLTKTYVDKVADFSCRLLDTRKTLPSWRLLEKYAVRCGGGHNHRMGLGDGILIKDNHLAALPDSGKAIEVSIQLARKQYGQQYPIELEVDTLDQLNQALAMKPDIILLDNMSTENLYEAVRRRNRIAPNVLLEASGGVNLSTIRDIACTGVDRISVGALTHSAIALDIALDYNS